MMPQRFLATDELRARYGPRLDRLGHFLLRSDDLADAAVAAIAELPRGAGWPLLDRCLREGIDAVPEAPEAFRALFAQLDAVPVWVDRESVDRGGELLVRTGILSALALAFGSLALSYCAPAGNKPLVFSGRLREQAAMRLDETARFVYAVCAPGGMARHGEGFAITVKVRLIHAQVRRMILASGRWRPELWGHPVNQHDMGAANLLFSGAVLDGLRKLGVAISEGEAARYMGLWRYVGWVIGVDPELLCATEGEARSLAELVRDTQGPPDADSRALIQALLNVGVQAAQSEAQRQRALKLIPFHEGLCRAFLGSELADQVGLPRQGWRFALHAARPLLASLETARKLPLGDRLAYAAGKRYWDLVTRRGLSRSDFGLPQRLGGGLGVSP